MMPKKITTLGPLALVFALALLGVGCGGSEDPPTKAEFTKEATAICRHSDNAEYAAKVAYGKKHEDEIHTVGIKSFTKSSNATVLPMVGEEAEELEDLGAPEGDEQQIEAFIADIEKGIERVEEDPSLSEEFGFKNAFEDANKRIAKYGVKECAFIG
jgi:hypothetical protein